MLGIVVLHEAVVWQFLADEGEQSVLQNAAVKTGFHYPFEDTDFGSTVPADTSPNMNFEGVLWFRLSLRWFTNLPVARTAELLKRDGTFITKDDVVEGIFNGYYLLCELKSLGLVYVADQLAVLRVLKSPSLLFACSSNSGWMNFHAMLEKLLLDLAAGCFVIFSHLCLDECLGRCVQLSGQTRLREVVDGTGKFYLLYYSRHALIADERTFVS